MGMAREATNAQINFYRWSEISHADRERIMRRSHADMPDVEKLVAPIVDDVKSRGDQALVDYALKFDGATIGLDQIKATEEDFALAESRLDADLKKAIAHSARNVEKFHAEQMRRVEDRWMFEVEPGVWAGEQVTAIPSVGLYVPRGKGAFPSSVIMIGMPARIAGVEEIHIVTPPKPDGSFDDATLYAAQLCGVKNVYKAGGAQGIAALAYGTETIPAVKKVLGPGSPYVQAAKKICGHVMNPGMPAGASDSLVLVDETAHIGNTILDLLNEVEHGSDSSGLLVTHSEEIARAVVEGLPEAIDSLPEPHRQICFDVMSSYGAVVLTDSLEQSIEVANEYAPEHLLLKVKDPASIIDKIQHAGEILIGEYTPSTFGNFVIGVNHVLPVGQQAHTYSCTTIWDYLKRTSLSLVDRQGFDALEESAFKFAEYEDFPAHGRAVSARELDEAVLVQPPSVDKL